jgi:hypothetical protein
MPFLVEALNVVGRAGRYDEDRECLNAAEVGRQVEDLAPVDGEEIAELVEDENLRGTVFSDPDTGTEIVVSEGSREAPTQPPAVDTHSLRQAAPPGRSPRTSADPRRAGEDRMKMVDVDISLDPRTWSAETMRNYGPKMTVKGYSCSILGIVLVVHRMLEGNAEDRPGLSKKTWTVTEPQTGLRILEGLPNETRERLIERSERLIESKGGVQAVRNAIAKKLKEEK